MRAMAGVQAYRIPTSQWSDSGVDSISIPNHDALAGLSMRWTGQYDTGVGTVRIRDGFLTQLINTIVIRRGGTTYFKARGMDLHFIHELLQKEPHGLVQVVNADSQANQTTGSPAQLDIRCSVPRDPKGEKATVELTFASAAGLGTSYTVDSASFNGAWDFAGADSIPPMRVIMLAGMNNKTGAANQLDIPVEGQLVALLCIARATASPNALRDPVGGLLQVRVEGVEKFEMDWLEAKEDYKNWVNRSAVQTGVGLLAFRDLPLVGGSSYLYVDLDGTATDVNVYGLYTAGGASLKTRSTVQDELRASTGAVAQVRGSLSPLVGAGRGQSVGRRL